MFNDSTNESKYHAWIKIYREYESAISSYQESKKKDIKLLSRVLETVENLLPMSATKSMFDDPYGELPYNLKGLKEVIESFSNEVSDDISLLKNQGKLRFLYAKLHTNFKKPERVLPLLEEAKEYFHSLYESEGIVISSYPVTLLEIGKIAIEENREKSIAYFSEALELFNKLENKDYEDLRDEVNLIQNLGTLTLHEKGFEEAKVIFTNILYVIEQLEKVPKTKEDSFVETYLSIARSLLLLQKNSTSQKFYEKVLDIYKDRIKKYLPEADKIDFVMQATRPSMSMQGGSYPDVFEKMEREKELWGRRMVEHEKQRILMDPRCQYCIISKEFAETVFSQSKLEEAKEIMFKAFKQYQEVFTKYPAFQPVHAEYHMILGDIAIKQGDKEDALTLLEEGWSIFKKGYVFDEKKGSVLSRLSLLLSLYGLKDKMKLATETAYELLGYFEDLDKYTKRNFMEVELYAYLVITLGRFKEENWDDCHDTLVTLLEFIITILDTADQRVFGKCSKDILNATELARGYILKSTEEKKKDNISNLLKQIEKKLERK